MEHKQYETREEYKNRQINASVNKLSYCKTSYRDVHRYLEIIRSNKREYSEQLKIGPVVCLGVRNGREVDLFRVALLSGWMRRQLVHCLEQKWHGFNPRIPLVESVGRSEYRNLSDKSCVGVEINPLVRRPDIWVGSFDELPEEWEQKFDVAFSNAFDHSFDALKTAESWCQILRPGGYLVIQFPERQTPSPLDPVGSLTVEDFGKLFPGEIVYFHARGSNWKYTEYIFRMCT
tara:strand:+ start:1090 stop:1788 length:699 start_codon:yes stop_codon:yes gene_type:complete